MLHPFTINTHLQGIIAKDIRVMVYRVTLQVWFYSLDYENNKLVLKELGKSLLQNILTFNVIVLLNNLTFEGELFLFKSFRKISNIS